MQRWLPFTGPHTAMMGNVAAPNVSKDIMICEPHPLPQRVLLCPYPPLTKNIAPNRSRSMALERPHRKNSFDGEFTDWRVDAFPHPMISDK